MMVQCCPFCSSKNFKLVVEGIDKYYECLECEEQWYTYEQLKEREEARNLDNDSN